VGVRMGSVLWAASHAQRGVREYVGLRHATDGAAVITSRELVGMINHPTR
jgi:hypothetical protein